MPSVLGQSSGAYLVLEHLEEEPRGVHRAPLEQRMKAERRDRLNDFIIEVQRLRPDLAHSMKYLNLVAQAEWARTGGEDGPRVAAKEWNLRAKGRNKLAFRSAAAPLPRRVQTRVWRTTVFSGTRPGHDPYGVPQKPL